MSEKNTATEYQFDEAGRIHVRNLSTENQRSILLSYCKDHHFGNPKFFIDDGYSGVNYDRPGFQAMLAEIEAGHVAVTSSGSRFWSSWS